MLRSAPSFALLAFISSLTGCSGGDGSSGPQVFTGPSGAVSLELFQAQDQTCPAGDVFVVIGDVRAAPPIGVHDGEDGAQVSCRVASSAGDAGPFTASASLAHLGAYVTIDGLVTNPKTSSASGEVHVKDPAKGTEYSSKSCLFEFAPGTSEGAKPGEIFVEFQCGNVTDPTDAASACSIRHGYLALSGCATK